jgi:putative addiction module antidote
MTFELKLRKIGDSLGVALPTDALERLSAGEGDTLIFTETPDGGFHVTSEKNNFARQMALAEDIACRYPNALKELAR